MTAAAIEHIVSPFLLSRAPQRQAFILDGLWHCFFDTIGLVSFANPAR